MYIVFILYYYVYNNIGFNYFFSNIFECIYINFEKIWYFYLFMVMEDYFRWILVLFNLLVFLMYFMKSCKLMFFF